MPLRRTDSSLSFAHGAEQLSLVRCNTENTKESKCEQTDKIHSNWNLKYDLKATKLDGIAERNHSVLSCDHGPDSNGFEDSKVPIFSDDAIANCERNGEQLLKQFDAATASLRQALCAALTECQSSVQNSTDAENVARLHSHELEKRIDALEARLETANKQSTEMMLSLQRLHNFKQHVYESFVLHEKQENVSDQTESANSSASNLFCKAAKQNDYIDGVDEKLCTLLSDRRPRSPCPGSRSTTSSRTSASSRTVGNTPPPQRVFLPQNYFNHHQHQRHSQHDRDQLNHYQLPKQENKRPPEPSPLPSLKMPIFSKYAEKAVNDLKKAKKEKLIKEGRNIQPSKSNPSSSETGPVAHMRTAIALASLVTSDPSSHHEPKLSKST